MEPVMRWDGSVEGQDDPNGHAQLIRLSNWGWQPISWPWEPLIPTGEVTPLVGEQATGEVVHRHPVPPRRPKALLVLGTPRGGNPGEGR